MRDLIAAGVVSIASLLAVNAAAQAPDETPQEATQETEMYVDEIRTACEAEAVGLADAQDYIRQCMKDMQQSFTGAQD